MVTNNTLGLRAYQLCFWNLAW